MPTKTLTFNKDNWSGEDGTVTYDTDNPLAFAIEGYGKFWLEPKSWGPEVAGDEELAEMLGDRFKICETPDHSIGQVTAWRGKATLQVEATAMGMSRDTSGTDFSDGESLLVAAARIIFNTA